MEQLISIQTNNLKNPEVIDLQMYFSSLQHDHLGKIEVTEVDNKSPNLVVTDFISLSILIEPIVKYGMEFLFKQLFEWLKKKVDKTPKEQPRYEFNIYVSENSNVFIATDIEKAERKITQIVKTLTPSRKNEKGQLYTLLGEGKIPELLERLHEYPDSLLGEEAEIIRGQTSQLKELLNSELLENGAIDTEKQAIVTRQLFDLIVRIPDGDSVTQVDNLNRVV